VFFENIDRERTAAVLPPAADLCITVVHGHKPHKTERMLAKH